ncbi:hypothetical protein B0T14DRAFT_563652 [Immersiella caudata]|uniref:PPPDE domain-containing protein n=1 Tax=Immersiella caudata TaxID=314043 RepID=A0AA39X5W7_9PEZI|nr:hypothetical protein B0T14DRAFT_563652 [Immersiella caudata]
MRPLDIGPGGPMLRLGSKISSRDTAEATHWGVEIWPYVWELFPDANGNVVVTASAADDWAPTEQRTLGRTRSSDDEIHRLAETIHQEMAEKKYDFKTHNCHHFAERLCILISDLDLQYFEEFKKQLRGDNPADAPDWKWLDTPYDLGHPINKLPNFFRSLRNTLSSR